MNSEVLKRFDYPHFLIKEYTYWAVVLRRDHVTPGSMIIFTKTSALHLGELGSKEWAEFSKVSKDCEGLVRKTFQAEKFNYLALMMGDPNVHFHFIPRYSKPIKVNGKEFIDRDWPLMTELIEQDFSEADLTAIYKMLENNI